MLRPEFLDPARRGGGSLPGAGTPSPFSSYCTPGRGIYLNNIVKIPPTGLYFIFSAACNSSAAVAPDGCLRNRYYWVILVPVFGAESIEVVGGCTPVTDVSCGPFVTCSSCLLSRSNQVGPGSGGSMAALLLSTHETVARLFWTGGRINRAANSTEMIDSINSHADLPTSWPGLCI